MGFVARLRTEADRTARDRGAMMLPAYGYDYVPGLIAAAAALRDVPEASGVDVR